MATERTTAWDPVIRPMTPEDLEAVAAIDRDASPAPWSANLFREELSVSQARNLVAVLNGRVVGYLGFWIVAGEVQVQNVVVCRDCRRRGVASGLLARMREMSCGERAGSATLEVRSRNEGAIRLYVKNGFVVKGTRRRYYDDGDDALIMWADL